MEKADSGPLVSTLVLLDQRRDDIAARVVDAGKVDRLHPVEVTAGCIEKCFDVFFRENARKNAPDDPRRVFVRPATGDRFLGTPKARRENLGELVLVFTTHQPGRNERVAQFPNRAGNIRMGEKVGFHTMVP